MEAGGSVTLTEDLVCTTSVELSKDDFTLDCGGNQISGVLSFVILVTGEDVTVTNCVTQGASYGIFVSGDGATIGPNNEVNDADTAGIIVSTSTGTIVNSNDVLDSDVDGIYVTNSESTIVSGNSVENSGDNGIYIINSDLSVVSDNAISETLGSGIRVHESDESEISLNVIENSNEGIYLTYTEFNSISSNQITNSETGIRVYASSSNVVIDNELSGITNKGFYFYLSDSNELSSNFLIDSESFGILLTQSSENEISSNGIFSAASGISLAFLSEENVVNSNHFCYSEALDDFTCTYSLENTGSGNFMDTITSCTPEEISCADTFSTAGEEIFLYNDLECSSNAISLEADDIIFDCNGHSISSDSGIGAGISIEGENIVIKNCEVTGFSIGIEIDPPTTSYTFSASIESSYIHDNNYGVHISNSEAGISDSHIIENSQVGITIPSSSTTGVLHSENNAICANGATGTRDIQCSGASEITSSGDTFDYLYDCSAFSITAESECDSSYEVELEDEETLFFPEDSTYYSCYENTKNACSDGFDNDLDGLIDCADDECENQAYGNDQICVGGVAVDLGIVGPGTATSTSGSSQSIFILQYFDFLTWLETGQVIELSESSTGICADECSTLGLECLFADAGASLCSLEASSKCTCI